MGDRMTNVRSPLHFDHYATTVDWFQLADDELKGWRPLRVEVTRSSYMSITREHVPWWRRLSMPWWRGRVFRLRRWLADWIDP